MRFRITLIYISICFFAHSQNGDYIANTYIYYATKDDPHPVNTNHKYIISVAISGFSGQGKIIIKDTYENTTVTFNLTGKIRDYYDKENDYMDYVYYGTINFFNFSQTSLFMMGANRITGALNFISCFDEQYNTQGYYQGITPLEETLSSSGTGFIISESGLLLTNYHVIRGAKTITISGIDNNFEKEYHATVVAYDKSNDIALLRIKLINGLPAIPYSILKNQKDVGERIFVLGYPMPDAMGSEIKLTDGLISSVSGAVGNQSFYQISSPVQPGNSGGPLFDAEGNIIGLVSSKLTDAENVGYALKSNAIVNFLSKQGVFLKSTNKINYITPLSAKVKELKKFIVIIISQR